MSDTDKTRPGWVSDFFDGTLEHDHTGGFCRPETLDSARAEARGAYRHTNRCRRISWVEVPCPTPGDRCATWLPWVQRCRGHLRRVVDDTVHCPSCAARADAPTCTRRIVEHWEDTQRRYGGGVPAWFRRQVHHAPMRRAARDVLHGAAREYNAGYRPDDDTHLDLEDAWEPPTRHHRSAAQLWW
jgi:hypothetical protein